MSTWKGARASEGSVEGKKETYQFQEMPRKSHKVSKLNDEHVDIQPHSGIRQQKLSSCA